MFNLRPQRRYARSLASRRPTGLPAGLPLGSEIPSPLTNGGSGRVEGRRGRNMQRRTWTVTVVLAAIALIGAACGGTSGDGAGAGGQSGLTGDIFISGSSTVEPISSLVAELFVEENPDVSITVEGPGTGDGFELFCNGETDISDASRPIEQEEIDACEANGIEYTELEVALDGISVLTSPNNGDVDCLNSADLYALTGPESEGFESWA